MKTLDVDFLVGFVLLMVIAGLMYISFNLGRVNFGQDERYLLYAEFPTVGGLQDGAIVELAGVQVGRVESVALTKDYRASVALRLVPSISLREDARAAIKSRGLIGERYVELSPGRAATVLSSGGKIRETEPPVDIMDVLPKFIFGNVENAGSGGAADELLP